MELKATQSLTHRFLRLALAVGLCSTQLMPLQSSAGQPPDGKNSADTKTNLAEARRRVLADRPYKLNPYQKISNLQLAIKPVNLQTETVPDWWSEKQSFDLAKLLELAMAYYPGLTVVPSETWEQASIQKELSQATLEPTTNIPALARRTRTDVQTVTLQPTITNYQFQLFKPKKRGIGLVFIAITSKSCKSESFISMRSEFSSSTTDNATLSITDKLSFGLGNGFDIARLQTTESGGTSLNVNAILAGAGGGDFKPPEKATKDLLYDGIVDLAEGTYCVLSGSDACNSYYQKRENPKPTPPAKDRQGKPLKLKPQDLKC